MMQAGPITVVDTLCSLPGMQGVVLGVYSSVETAFRDHPQPERLFYFAPTGAKYLSDSDQWLDENYNPINL